MNRDQYSPVFDAAFVAFGLVFRNAHSNQCTGQPSHCTSDPRPSECSHDRSRRDEWAKSRYGQSSNADQPSQGASQHYSRSSASRCTFRCLCILLVREIFRSHIFWKQNRNIGVPESCCLQGIDPAFHIGIRGVDTEYGRIFTCHENSPFVSWTMLEPLLLVRQDRQFVNDLVLAGYFISLGLDCPPLVVRAHGPLQSDDPVLRNNLHIVGVG